MIHRHETVSLFGVPVSNYIDIEDSEEILHVTRFTPNDQPIDMILHTPGGLVLAAEQIAMALVRHKGKVTVFVPHYPQAGTGRPSVLYVPLRRMPSEQQEALKISPTAPSNR
jgi:hypothetical protein